MIVVGVDVVELDDVEAGAVTVVVTVPVPLPLLLAYAHAKKPIAASSTMIGIHHRPMPLFFSGSLGTRRVRLVGRHAVLVAGRTRTAGMRGRRRTRPAPRCRSGRP